MNDGTYNEGEPQQELIVKVVFKIKHSPGSEAHLKHILWKYMTEKGVEFNGEEIII
jgi:hypothetical protein